MKLSVFNLELTVQLEEEEILAICPYCGLPVIEGRTELTRDGAYDPFFPCSNLISRYTCKMNKEEYAMNCAWMTMNILKKTLRKNTA